MTDISIHYLFIGIFTFATFLFFSVGLASKDKFTPTLLSVLTFLAILFEITIIKILQSEGDQFLFWYKFNYTIAFGFFGILNSFIGIYVKNKIDIFTLFFTSFWIILSIINQYLPAGLFNLDRPIGSGFQSINQLSDLLQTKFFIYYTVLITTIVHLANKSIRYSLSRKTTKAYIFSTSVLLFLGVLIHDALVEIGVFDFLYGIFGLLILMLILSADMAFNMVQATLYKRKFVNTSEKLQNSENAIKLIIETTSSRAGKDFLNEMVVSLNKIVDADYTFIGKSSSFQKIKTIALCQRGTIIDNFEYELEGTPCANVVHYSTRIYPQKVQKLFPKNQLLIYMGINAYVGTPIFNRQGDFIGLIVALFCKTLKHSNSVKSLFELFASQIGSELERINTENELRISEAKYRTVVENMPSIVYRCTFGKERVMQLLSRQIHKLTGYSSDEFINNKRHLFQDIIHPNDIDRVNKTIIEQVKIFDTYDIEYRIIDVHGIVHWFVDRGSANFGEDGKVKWLDGVINDITSRKQTENELKEYHDQLEKLVEQRTQKLERINKLYVGREFRIKELKDEIEKLKNALS